MSTPESERSSSQTDEAQNDFDISGSSDQTYAEAEVSILDGLLVIAKRRTLIAYTVATFTAIGVLYAVLAPTEYTSTAQVVREAPVEAANLPGGLAALGSGLGLSLGGASSGLTPEAYPSILRSREVRLAVARDTFYFPDVDRRMTYIDYYNREPGVLYYLLQYTVMLPWTLKKNLFPSSPRPVGVDSTGVPLYPTEEEEEAVDELLARLSSSVDLESGIMTIRFTASDPGPAAEITRRFLHHLNRRVRAIRTKKTSQTLDFVSGQFTDAKQELRTAEEQLAEFADRNQNINSAQLRTERDRLQRQVRFASDLYSNLQEQLTKARIELKRSEPVITVVEEPVPPSERSSPKRTITVIFSVVFGTVVGLVLAFLASYVDREEGARGYRKIKQIKEKLTPTKVARLFDESG